MATSINNSAWLEWITGLMGGVSRQAHAATFPPDRFYCLLDELPVHLIPKADRRCLQEEHVRRDLYLNPDLVVCPGDQIPEDIAAKEFVAGFAQQGTMVWVPDRRTRSWLPFWLGPGLERVVAGLRRNEPVPDSVSSNALGLLHGAGILLQRGTTDNCIADPDFPASAAAELFQKKGYAPVTNLIHPFHIAALRRYYRYLIRSGAVKLGDGQSPRRYIAYNEPVARFFHRQIATPLSILAGETVKPSYVYLASYLSGAELRKHTDREQCEFSVTLCLDYSPEPELATPWPICLDTAAGQVKVYQALGDGLAYRGTKLPHYRSKLREGQTSTSIFFHYVASDFTGSLA
jgi:hypothetical protein